MKTNGKFTRTGNKIAYSVATVIVLIAVFMTMIGYIYHNAEKDALENLHVQTSEIKEDINLQMISDRENLITMANFASKLYSDGESPQLMLDSFKAIGLIQNIGILNSDNHFITKIGTIDANGLLSFEDEVQKGQYISGRVKDVTNPDREVIRSAVPIVVGDRTVAMLYGVIELSTLRDRYMPMAQAQNAQLFVLERSNGNFIIDTAHDELGNLIAFGSRETKKGYSPNGMLADIQSSLAGYTALRSQTTGAYQYIHYAPLNISDWHIMLSKPEHIVFDDARKTETTMIIMFLIVVIIMCAYLLLMFTSERKNSDINRHASKIRKLLLEINQHDNSIKEALREITQYSKSRSAFFVDTDNEDYNYILPALQQKLLCGDDRKYFVQTVLNYASKFLKERNASVVVIKIYADSFMERDNPKFYDFMESHNIDNLSIAGIADASNRMSILGVINAKRQNGVRALLSDIAVCFSIAIYNKKNLNQTKIIATTDSLTKLFNRTSYKSDIIRFNNQTLDLFSCVYIDVNELHMYNNKYGHAAGDSMLCSIADALTETFYGNYIYRMGGDEFLVFTHRLEKEAVEQLIDSLIKKVDNMGYHISTGLAFHTDDINIEDLVKEAEKRMYEAKAEYYQQKEQRNHAHPNQKKIELISTGMSEVDTILSIISQRYHCIYIVSLENDVMRQMLMPDYLRKYAENNNAASKVFAQYVHEKVHTDYQRALLNFLNYDALKKHIAEGTIPSMTYTNTSDEIISLNIYGMSNQTDGSTETVWVFEKIDER